ncbi:polysaccharide lyase 8 family protein [Allorhizocola rhizosphaerae]|uniref:polysaccharide lyase 8 family protein n=1 Tax=Allorhizocola rhizosphaerae TaxID=1872709 RepID=UPI000E3E1D11|nr:polysaccharide lyase 8 family protein [Allorhizocola rhizosphaerae]
MKVSRRHIIGLPALSAGAVLLGDNAARAHVTALDAYTTLRDRWCDIVTGAGKIDLGRPEFAAAINRMDNGVDSSVALIDRSSGRNRVFTDLPLAQTTDSGMVATTHSRLRGLAIAWYTPGSRHYHSSGLLADILAGLDTANRLVYNASRAEFDNWWDWEIGASRALADCLVLLDGQIPVAARDRYVAAIRHFVPDPWYMYIDSRRKPSTGANRVDLCQAALVEGIASRSSARIQRAADGLPAVCEYVDSGDGLYADGSFIQHANVAYTGSYGQVQLAGMANLLALLKGSAWELTDPAIGNLLTAVEQGWAPLIHNGRMMSMVNGRAIARTSNELALGHGTIAAILQMAYAADPAMAQRWRQACRGWFDRSGARGPYDGATVARTALVSTLMNDPAITPAPEPDRSWIFRNMARAVHRRNGWCFAISMCCNKIARYETINGENLKGFHTGAGMTYLYDDDATQYTDNFWPTVDPYRLAGTTIDRKLIADKGGRALPTVRWAGGAVHENKYLAVGMTLQGAETNLEGKKSWFCFDEYVVCTGVGITCTSGFRVETLLENRKLHTSGANKLIVNGVEWSSAQGATQTWTDAQWAHLEGVGGYIYPSPRPLTARRYERTGSFRDINETGSTTPITRRYLTLSQEHGANPTNASYFYLVAPKATVERTAELYTNRNVAILNNNPKIQSVRQSSTGITMANFWDSAGGTTGNITVNWCCSVVVQEKDNRLVVSVAEPYRSGTTIRIRVAAAFSDYRLLSKDSNVTVVSTGATITLDVRPSTFGRTMAATFTR